MKVFYKFMILVVLLFSFSYFSLYSYDDCKIFCPEIEWQTTGATPFPVPGCSGCTFVAYWSYRYLDCPELGINWCDFKLDAIGCAGCPPSCWSCVSLFDLTHEAMKFVVNTAGRNTLCVQNLESDSCTATFSVNYSACWQFSSVGPSGPTELIPCDETKCCKEIWKICKDQYGYPEQAILVTRSGVNPVCESGSCFAICEEFPLQYKSNTDISSNYNYIADIFPNPSSDFITLVFISDRKGEYTVEINDIFGKKLIEEVFDFNIGENRQQFDMSIYPSGTYFYSIKNQGELIINGVFHRVK